MNINVIQIVSKNYSPARYDKVHIIHFRIYFGLKEKILHYEYQLLRAKGALIQNVPLNANIMCLFNNSVAFYTYRLLGLARTIDLAVYNFKLYRTSDKALLVFLTTNTKCASR